jgi:hypothetical protein
MNRSSDQYGSRRLMNSVDCLYCWCKNLSPHLLFRTVKIIVYKIFLLLCMGVQLGMLLREDCARDIQKIRSDGLLKKNTNLFPNHLHCHLMYVPYTTFQHRFHH